jgi:hypothetical protein
MWVSVLLESRADRSLSTLLDDFAIRDDLHRNALYSANEATQGVAQRFQYFQIIDPINIAQEIAPADCGRKLTGRRRVERPTCKYCRIFDAFQRCRGLARPRQSKFSYRAAAPGERRRTKLRKKPPKNQG